MKLDMIFIRHGTTAGNEQRRYVGQLGDPPLTQAGREQLRLWKDAGRYPAAGALYTSPLTRCRETAQILYPRLTPAVLPLLIELHMGTFEGKTYEQLKDDPAYRAWIDTRGMSAPPGGESGAAFSKRLETAMSQIAEDAQRRGIRCAAVITHGGCIMTLFQRFVSQPDADLYQFLTPNGGGYTAVLDTESMTLSRTAPILL